MHGQYQRAGFRERSILDEVCLVCGYHRKHAIRKLNQPLPDKPMRRRSTQRGLTDAQVLGVLKAVWKAANCPWLICLSLVESDRYLHGMGRNASGHGQRRRWDRGRTRRDARSAPVCVAGH